MVDKSSKKRADASVVPVEQPPATKSVQSNWMAWIVFNATVAVAAACIMGVEILSTRLVARYLGASLYTWTSAIGVVLACISLGNYVGGRIADRYRPRQTLSSLFIGSSLLVARIPMVSTWLGEWSALDVFSWPTHIFLHFLIVFVLPVTMLGTMSPVVAKNGSGRRARVRANRRHDLCLKLGRQHRGNVRGWIFSGRLGRHRELSLDYRRRSGADGSRLQFHLDLHDVGGGVRYGTACSPSSLVGG